MKELTLEYVEKLIDKKLEIMLGGGDVNENDLSLNMLNTEKHLGILIAIIK